jgi:hypothetical protein
MGDVEGPLFVETLGVWEEMYGTLKGRAFTVYEKIRHNVPASRQNKGNHILEVR